MEDRNISEKLLEELAQLVTEVQQSCIDEKILIAGDFNGRIG